ncbi:hypothetical protein GCM10010222_77740 [Streptomyces tanashiensis]|uniref:hypothetical protein n=1 Tax=Streptomyces tanashiensis TaxID=67367 RepID=UPI001678464C|nr:hypothetical protein [Streptomyces tanashiensis]GGT24202.1 hypothetical protein GCM10010222_77740 [Streptomyces tanashiensis]
MNPTDLTRRRALVTAAGATAAASLASTGLLATPAAAAPRPPVPPPAGSDALFENDELKAAIRRAEARHRRFATGRPSANGWEMQKAVDVEGDIITRPVVGTGLTVAVRAGDPATLLIHVIRRFHYEVEALGRAGEPDQLEGWVPPAAVRDGRLPESNQASGTAVVIRPGSYPRGVRGGFTAGQVLVVRDILADTEGLVRWGGDERRPYEGLFHLAARPGDARLALVAGRLRAWEETPGQGAGVIPDVTAPTRRRRAARYGR